MDLDRAYVVNGDDLRIALAELAGKPSTPGDAAEYVLNAAKVRDVVIVSHGQLARALDGVTVWCEPDGGQAPDHTFAGKITNAEAVARRVLGVIARPDPWAPDDVVVDAHIHCDHVLDGGPASDELEAMDKIAALLRTRSDRAVKRILAWALDRLTDIGEPPF